MSKERCAHKAPGCDARMKREKVRRRKGTGFEDVTCKKKAQDDVAKLINQERRCRGENLLHGSATSLCAAREQR